MEGMIETEDIKCAECGIPITVYFGNNISGARNQHTGGVISRPEYVLVADWIFHTECWNKKVDENPP